MPIGSEATQKVINHLHTVLADYSWIDLSVVPYATKAAALSLLSSAELYELASSPEIPERQAESHRKLASPYFLPRGVIYMHYDRVKHATYADIYSGCGRGYEPMRRIGLKIGMVLTNHRGYGDD